jgi:Raf kinase inhibitor-like YbhB/YbcL family protein
MQIRSDSLVPYAWIDERLAFGRFDAATNIALAGNRNPHLAWSDPPTGTRSFALFVFDPDVPTAATYVNRTDCTVPLDFPRGDFFHWVVVDLPADLREIAEGAHSDGVVARGKPVGPTPSGGRTGLNDYTGWFAGDAEMKGDYAGYDGPCPPFNDERVHGYRFEIVALDVERVALPDRFDGPAARRAIEGHVLARATLLGRYAIRPASRLD